jgi:hypothetical protein
VPAPTPACAATSAMVTTTPLFRASPWNRFQIGWRERTSRPTTCQWNRFHEPVFAGSVATGERSRRQAATKDSMPKLRFGIDYARLSTNRSSWRRLRHSKVPSQKVAYSPMIESPVSQ